MKKLLMLAAGICLIIALTACGAKNDAAAPSQGDSAQAPAQEITLKATNYQFDNQEYHVKKGQPLKITLDNAQGVHGAAIKDLKVNLDNKTKSVVITPDKEGSYPIICSIMCGSGHASMKATLIVE